MKTSHHLCTLAFVCASAIGALAQSSSQVVVTASNTTTNDLLVYDTSGQLLATVPTGGAGGVSGNAGGIASQGGRVAVVNFGSQNVSIFTRSDSGFHLEQLIPSTSSPVSVAFGHGHLYILGATSVESHQAFDFGVNLSSDGISTLLKSDGSAAQVGVLETQLIVTEKSNAIETVAISGDGAVTGTPTLVSNIPPNVNAPFGLVTRDDEAYVSIAHSNEISLVRRDTVITTTGSGTQVAPCWLALDGPWLYSTNPPSHSVSRYLVYGREIIQKEAAAASFIGAPTDITYNSGFLGVIDNVGGISHLSLFHVDADGNLIPQSISTVTAPINGVAVVSGWNE
jgi:hypothetical protein